MEKAPGPSPFDQKATVSGFEQQQSVKVVYYRAVYPFDARSHDEISIAPGDVIMVCNIHTNLIPIHSYPPAIQLATKTHYDDDGGADLGQLPLWQFKTMTFV